jgi:hypothetical protein
VDTASAPAFAVGPFAQAHLLEPKKPSAALPHGYRAVGPASAASKLVIPQRLKLASAPVAPQDTTSSDKAGSWWWIVGLAVVAGGALCWWKKGEDEYASQET